MIDSTTLRLAVGVLTLVGSALASGAEPAASAAPSGHVYGVLSLIGDEFSVVTRRDSVGSGLDRNEQTTYPIDGSSLDDVAVAAVVRTAARLLPGMPVVRVSIRDPRLFALQDLLLAGDANAASLRSAVRDVLMKANATELVLITKRRQEATFKLQHSSTGAGKLQGVGFYIDNQKRVRQVETGERSQGYLGPYAYATVALIDVASMHELRSLPAGATQLITPAHSATATRAWDSLTSEEKIRALDRVIGRAVGEASGELLAP